MTTPAEIIRLPLVREAAVIAPEALVGMCGDDDARHCQLTVARNEASSAPDVEEPGSYSDPWLVRVPLVKDGGGCEYIVRVGMERTSGQPTAGVIGSETLVVESGVTMPLARPYVPITVTGMDGTEYLPNYDYYWNPANGIRVPNRSRIDNGDRITINYQGGGEPPSTTSGRPMLLRMLRVWDGSHNTYYPYALPLAELDEASIDETIYAVKGGWAPLATAYASVISVRSGRDGSEYRKNDDYYWDPVRGIRVPLASRIEDGEALRVKSCSLAPAPAERPVCDKFEFQPLPVFDPTSRLFPIGCYKMLQVRYLDTAGYPVSLYIYTTVSYDEFGAAVYWENVMVTRHSCVQPVFRRQWQQHDNLRVCAALSNDLTTLYIVYSVGLIGQQSVYYQTHVFNAGTGEWEADQDRSGSVGYKISYSRHSGTTVDRAGVIGSFYNLRAYNRDASDSDGSCMDDHYTITSLTDHGYVLSTAARYNINSKMFSASGTITGGISVLNYEIAIIGGASVKEDCSYSETETFWSWFPLPPYAGSTRVEIGSSGVSTGPNGDTVSWSLGEGAGAIGLGDQFTTSQGATEHGFKIKCWQEIEGGHLVTKYTWSRDLYSSYLDTGSQTLSFGRGPVIMYCNATRESSSPYKIFYYEGYGSPTKQCPGYPAPAPTESITRVGFEVKHPDYASIDDHGVAAFQQDAAEILNWFWSVDNAASVDYFGLYFRRKSEATPVWKIYRNGDEITDDILACEGDSSTVQAIYLMD